MNILKPYFNMYKLLVAISAILLSIFLLEILSEQAIFLIWCIITGIIICIDILFFNSNQKN
jgi:hypothetical protein